MLDFHIVPAQEYVSDIWFLLIWNVHITRQTFSERFIYASNFDGRSKIIQQFVSKI